MASLAQSVPMSEEEYFQLLERSALKYEYWDGYAVAMGGVQPDHVRIEANLVAELFGKLRGRDCLPLVSNKPSDWPAQRATCFPTSRWYAASLSTSRDKASAAW